MTQETKTQVTTPAAELVQVHLRSNRLVTVTRLLAIALPIAVLATAAAVLPGWIPVLPRAVRRGMVEAALRGVLIGYIGLVLAAVIGTPTTVWLAARSRRKGRIRPGILRGFAICLVSLVS